MKLSFEQLIPNLNLPAVPFVVDVGAFRGNFTDVVLEHFNNAYVLLFEPHPVYYEVCRGHFGLNGKITVENKAVGEKHGKANLYLRDESSSFWKNWAHSEDYKEVEVVTLTDYFKSMGRIDFLKLNCEGAEYGIIRELTLNGTIKKIHKILVQFHKHTKPSSLERTIFFDNRRALYKEAQENLNKTHLKSGYERWELWSLKTAMTPLKNIHDTARNSKN